MKKTTFYILTTLLLCLFAGRAAADEQVTINHIIYEVDNSTNTAFVKSVEAFENGAPKNLGPKLKLEDSVQVNGTWHRVTKIAKEAFKSYKNNNESENLDSLELILPEYLETIEEYAFEYCEMLHGTLVIPKHVVDVNKNAFNYESEGETVCSCHLKKIVVNATPNQGIYYCNRLQKVDFTDEPSEICKFWNLNPDTLVIGENVKSFYKATVGFYNNDYVDNVNTVYWNAINCNTDVDFTYARNIYFGPKVEVIPTYLCYYNNNIETLTIPANVKEVGEYSFICMSGLKNLYLNGDNIKIPYNAFIQTFPVYMYYNIVDGANLGRDNGNLPTPFHSISTLDIGPDAKSLPDKMCTWAYKLTTVTIPEQITHIGDKAFWLAKLTTVNYNAINATVGDSPFGEDGIGLNDLTYCTLENINFGDKVESIPAKIVRGLKNITSVTIPSTVKTIGYQAFYGTSLTNVNIPESVTAIGDSAFVVNSTLDELKYYAADAQMTGTPFSSYKKLTIGDQVTKIPAKLAYKNTFLESLKLTENITEIGDSAFYGCSGIKTLEYYPAKATMTKSALEGLNSVTTVTVGEKVESIPETIASCCYNATTLNYLAKSALPTSTAICGPNLSNLTLGKSIRTIPQYFAKGSQLESVTLPDSVETIGISAFQDTHIPSVSIPSSVKRIGDNAFNTSYLTSLTYNSQNAKLGTTPFGTSVTSLSFGDSVKTIPATLVSRCPNITKVTIPKTVTTIGNQAFNGCSYLRTLDYDAPDATIGTYAFGKNITSVTLGKDVKVIPNRFLLDCTGLTSVSLSDSVTTIGASAFQNTGITALTITQNVTSIGDNAFSGTNIKTLNYNAIRLNLSQDAFGTAVTDVTIGKDVRSIPYRFLYKNTGLTALTIPDSIESIGEEAFALCQSIKTLNYNAIKAKVPNASFGVELETLNIGENVDSIPDKLAYQCTKLSSITIPEKVKHIGFEAFYGCTGVTTLNYNAIDAETYEGSSVFPTILKEVNIGSNVKSIPRYFLKGCTNVTTIAIPDNVTHVKEYAFSGCTGLKEILIGDTTSFNNPTADLETLDTKAFYGLSGLQSVYACTKQMPVCNTSFQEQYCKGASLYVPSSLLSQFQTSLDWKYFGNMNNNPTSVRNIQSTDAMNHTNTGHKFLHQGKLIIVGKDGKQYSATGQELPNFFPEN